MLTLQGLGREYQIPYLEKYIWVKAETWQEHVGDQYKSVYQVW